jgi:bifunctional non-homologous end joining protein LigD
LPKLTSLARSPGSRTGQVYLDYARNSFAQTIVAPYSLRAAPSAPVSTPLDWRELTSGMRPSRYNLRTIFRRLHGKGDIWKKSMRGGVNLRRLTTRLERMLDAERNKTVTKKPAKRRNPRRRT